LRVVNAWHPHEDLAARLASHGDAQAGALGVGRQDLAALVAGCQAVGYMPFH
jgi:hypothetical protein